MDVAIFIVMLFVLLFSILAFLYRKPGPKGEKGDKGRDGYICDNLTKERIIELLKDCDEINLPNTIIHAKKICKMK